MRSAKLTTARTRRTALFIFAIFTFTFASAQENSPYSRYGLGDLIPAKNMVSRSMGGISAGFIDSTSIYPSMVTPSGKFVVASTSINLANPASLGSLNTTLFDLGGEIDTRTLKSNNSPQKYTATNTIISYLQLGFPVTPKKMLAKGNFWSMSFGLRPVTRVNYKIIADKRLAGIDSLTTLFEGTGGLNQANFSTGLKFKNFSFGISTGYSFGNRETSTKIGFNNDSVPNYKQSNTEAESRFSGGFLDLGVQYAFHLKNHDVLRVGLTANLTQNLKAKRNNVNETFIYNGDGVVVAVDTVNFLKDQKGRIKLPASYSAGFTYTNANWVLGADVDYTSWSQYRYFGEKDAVQNNVTVRAGAQYYPAKAGTTSKKYWRFVRYRAGAYYGNDYVNLGSDRPDYGITLGAGLPLTTFQRLRLGEFVLLNTGVEIGQHGNKENLNVREGIFRINFGIAVTASWFQKRKYD